MFYLVHFAFLTFDGCLLLFSWSMLFFVISLKNGKELKKKTGAAVHGIQPVSIFHFLSLTEKTEDGG